MSSADRQGDRTVVLIGMRGSGKTAVGRVLASLLGGEHVDTDDRVGERAGRSIAQIFEAEGESGFRRREREVIAEVVHDPPAVVSVGGGAILDETNVRKLQSAGMIVWLTAPVERLWERIQNDTGTGDTRPALTDRLGADELRQLLDEREPRYRNAADITIDTSHKEPSAIAEQIVEQLRKGP